jgi:hypothetical protein
MALSVVYVLLGVAVLSVSAAVFFDYERSGASQVLSSDAVPELRSLI